MFRRWLRSPFLRPIAYLASGAALAQAIGFLATPIITRLFGPSQYGVLAVYGAIVSIVVAVASGRYETAISLPDESEQGESEAIALVQISLRCVVATTCVSMVAVIGSLFWWHLDFLETLAEWAILIPVGVLASGSAAVLSAYAVRRRRYSTLARVAPLQKALSSSAQLAAGLLKTGYAGLILGSLLQPLIGLSVLSKIYRDGRRSLEPREDAAPRLWKVARSYSDFPRISIWFALLNAVSWNIQAIILAFYYGPSEVGLYALAFATIGLPSNLILTGVSQVYLRECAARVNDRDAALRLAVRTIKSLSLASIPLFAILYFAARYLFGIVFGADWERAGIIAVTMIPLLWARFLSTSLTTTFNVYRRQVVLLLWQIVAFCVTVASYVLAGRNGWRLEDTILVASLLTAPLYLAILPMALATIRRGRRKSQE